MPSSPPDTRNLPVSVSDHETRGAPARSRYERRFFLGMACLFPVISALGFAPSYHADFTGKMKLHWFAHVHGAIMAGWLALFFVQSFLAARGQLKYHRRLGIFSAGWGLLVWTTMGAALVRAMLEFPPALEDESNWDIVTLSVGTIFLFGAFFFPGIALRRNAASHKRLLLLATLVLMQAGIDRIPWLPGVFTVYYARFIYLDILLIPLLAYDFVTLRRIHRVTLLGGALLLAVQVFLASNLGSPSIHRFWFDRLAPYVDKPVEVTLTEAQTAPLLGHYGWEKWEMVVFRQDGKVWFQLPDQTPMELFATSETELFLRRMIWKISFVKGADGKVVKIINHQPRVNWEAPRR